MPGTIVTEVTLNHEFLMSSYHTDSEQALARIGVAMHGGKDLKVLIGGLGLGYTAEAALACKTVVAVEVIELLGQVIGWLEEGLLPLSKTLLEDQRLQVTEGDGYRKMWQQPDSVYDLILIDIDHSPDDRLGTVDASFYSVEGLERARRHLAPLPCWLGCARRRTSLTASTPGSRPPSHCSRCGRPPCRSSSHRASSTLPQRARP